MDFEFGAEYLNVAANDQVFVFGDREDELLCFRTCIFMLMLLYHAHDFHAGLLR